MIQEQPIFAGKCLNLHLYLWILRTNHMKGRRGCPIKNYMKIVHITNSRQLHEVSLNEPFDIYCDDTLSLQRQYITPKRVKQHVNLYKHLI